MAAPNKNNRAGPTGPPQMKTCKTSIGPRALANQKHSKSTPPILIVPGVWQIRAGWCQCLAKLFPLRRQGENSWENGCNLQASDESWDTCVIVYHHYKLLMFKSWSHILRLTSNSCQVTSNLSLFRVVPVCGGDAAGGKSVGNGSAMAWNDDP